LPYPDISNVNDEAHGGKYELGTNKEDDGSAVVSFFTKYNLKLLSKKYDSYREPEIWLTLIKN